MTAAPRRVQIGSAELWCGDARATLAELPAGSVQCVVTSPPYYGLRDYGTAQWDGGDAECDHGEAYRKRRNEGGAADSGDGGIRRSERDPQTAFCKCGARRIDAQIGLEATHDEYIAQMVAVFREVRRVLRADGTVWCNLGDSYNNRTKVRTSSHQPALNNFVDDNCAERAARGGVRMSINDGSIKEKDLMLMPARVALALQADGWFVRSQMPWIKRSCMPESTTDRPTSAIEYVYLFTKSPRYFFDAQAVNRQSSANAHEGYASNGAKTQAQSDAFGVKPSRFDGYRPAFRNFRNSDLFFDSLEPPYGMILSNGEPLALDINPAAFASAHFATFPAGLVEPLIRAGTSERGCCAACGRPWARQTQATGGILGQTWGNHADDLTKGNASNGHAINRRTEEPYQRTTTGWAPTCKCDADVVPCTVLDCFSGAGTTALVADRLGRRAIGIELNPDYIAMSVERIRRDAGMFAHVEAPATVERATQLDLLSTEAA